MLTRWLALALVAASWRSTDACSCQLQHPQTHFCRSDFVIVGRVQKMFRGNDDYEYNSYKVKIRNIFKATPKAALALKSGRILTAYHSALCGVNLQPRETYVITGSLATERCCVYTHYNTVKCILRLYKYMFNLKLRDTRVCRLCQEAEKTFATRGPVMRKRIINLGSVLHLQAHISLCGYVNKWREVTPRQRKGFRLLYKQGCTCKVHETRRITKSPNTCVTNYDECYERHGICLHDREKKCRWTRAPALTRCLQAQTFNGTSIMT